MKNKTDIAVYQVDDKTNLSVRLDADTIWMTQKQIAILFGCDRTNITHHLKSIFKDGELEEKSVCEDFSHTAADGKTYNVAYYNLDAVISVGFRVNSKRGIAFRQWANKVIRDRMKNEFAQAAAARAAEKSRKQLPCAHPAKPRRLAPRSLSRQVRRYLHQVPVLSAGGIRRNRGYLRVPCGPPYRERFSARPSR